MDTVKGRCSHRCYSRDGKCKRLVTFGWGRFSAGLAEQLQDKKLVISASIHVCFLTNFWTSVIRTFDFVIQFSQSMLVSLLTRLCFTWPQWGQTQRLVMGRIFCKILSIDTQYFDREDGVYVVFGRSKCHLCTTTVLNTISLDDW